MNSQMGERIMFENDSDSSSSLEGYQHHDMGMHRMRGPIDTTPKVTVAAKDVGMNCSPKHVYEGKPYCNCCINWIEEKPELKDPIESEKTAGYALLIRNKISHGTDGRKAMEIHSIVIQSPLLKRFLGKVLENYPGVTPTLDRLTFSAPFQAFVHRWDRMEKAVNEEQDELTKSHLNLLLEILNNELTDVRNAMKDFVAHKVITFEHLWTIFVPGDIIFSKVDGQECAFKLKDASLARTNSGKIFFLNCEFVDWNGDSFGKGITGITLGEYSGTQAIADLNAFPLQYHSEKDQVMARIMARSKKFKELSSVLYRSYEGLAYETIPFGLPGRDKKKHQIEGRIVIDASGYSRFCPDVEINLGPLEETALPPSIDPSLRHNHRGPRDVYDPPSMKMGSPPFYHPPPPLGRRGRRSGVDVGFGSSTGVKAQETQLTDEQLLICHHLVRGFSLKVKKWLNFHINDIDEICWNETAFDSLVIPAEHKKLLMALSKSQNSSQAKFDDVIAGKGKGMVMLLSGPPGVGKTLTAESVAEVMRVPLYAISAGDLGLNPMEVQHRLSKCFQIVTSWNAVLLLDEADVFMEQRTVHDLVRNELVSIFLQNLEYYEGTMFLTTNRVEAFDAAFQSRVHVSIQYSDLTFDSRQKIWNNFLNRLPDSKHEIDEQALAKFAEKEMNGRQIKNLIKAAGLIAAEENSVMKVEHVETVLRIMQPS